MGYGGAFWINNASNDSAAIIGLTVGNGPAVYGLAGGNGNAGLFQVTNNLSTADALVATNAGTGNSAFFQGKVKIADGTEGLNKVLTSDATGGASWQIPTSTSGGWTRTAPNVFLTVNTDSVGIGTSTPKAKLHLKSSGKYTPLIIQSDSLQANPFIKLQDSSGVDLMWIHSDDPTNTFIGFESGKNNSAATGGYANTFVGYGAGFAATNGPENTAFGYGALNANNGQDNTAMGVIALSSSTTGIYNAAFGAGALANNTSGNYNTALGTEAGMNNLTGNKNLFLGFRAGANETGSDKLYIANSDTSVPLIYGDFLTAQIGLGTPNPESHLHILNNSGNQLKIGHKNQPANEWYFNADASANLSIVNEGNGTASTKMFLENSGNIGMSTTSPLYKLQIEDPVMMQPQIMLNTSAGSFNLGYRMKSAGGEWLMGKETGEFDMFKIKYINGVKNFTGFSMISNSNPPKIGIGTSDPLEYFHIRPDEDGTQDSSFVMTMKGDVGIGLAAPGAKLHVAGKIRMGSEQGTTEPPSQASGYSGMVIRRINSSTYNGGQIVALLAPGVSLTRGSLPEQMVIVGTAGSGQRKISVTTYSEGGAAAYSTMAGTGTGTNSFSSATAIKYVISCLVNDEYTEVTLMRISTTTDVWMGTVISTVDQ